MEIHPDTFVLNITIYIEGITCEYHDNDWNGVSNEENVRMDFPSKVLYDSDHNVSTTCEHIKSLFNVCMGKLFP